MANYNHIHEQWWSHLGCYDREAVSGRAYHPDDEHYLRDTDAWWNSLTGEQKAQHYEDFFAEY